MKSANEKMLFIYVYVCVSVFFYVGVGSTYQWIIIKYILINFDVFFSLFSSKMSNDLYMTSKQVF